LADAQAYFECANIACPGANPFNLALAGPSGDPRQITGINDLNVRGSLFDVTFIATAPAASPFVLSQSAAAPQQPLNGIDAGNAISAFFGAIPPPYGTYPFRGDPGAAFITAFAPSGASGAKYFGATVLWDVAETSVGGGTVPSMVFGNNGYNSSGGQIVDNSNELYYTKWARVAAPEIDPDSAAGGVALLFGGIAVLRGRRQRVLIPA